MKLYLDSVDFDQIYYSRTFGQYGQYFKFVWDKDRGWLRGYCIIDSVHGLTASVRVMTVDNKHFHLIAESEYWNPKFPRWFIDNIEIAKPPDKLIDKLSYQIAGLQAELDELIKIKQAILDK